MAIVERLCEFDQNESKRSHIVCTIYSDSLNFLVTAAVVATAGITALVDFLVVRDSFPVHVAPAVSFLLMLLLWMLMTLLQFV